MINIKKILCDLDTGKGYIEVWELCSFIFLLGLLACFMLLLSSIIGHIVCEIYINGFDNIRTSNGLPLVQLITATNVVTGVITISITLIILYVVGKISKMKIVSCDIKREE